MTTPARPWLPIPSPIRRLFTSFPLQTFPPAPLPSSCPQPSDVPRLFIHASSPADLPSWDAQSLKWQTFLRLHWTECVVVPGSVHSSPSGELPFLILPSTEIVPLHKLHHLTVSKFEIPANPRATVFLNLVDTKIHAAWVYAHFMTDEFEKSVVPLLSVPDGVSALQYLVRYSVRAGRKKELEKRCLKGIRQDIIYADAEDAFAALSTLLGTHTYFFNERQPGLLDVAVFAYVFTATATLDEKNKFSRIIHKFDNLVRHADTIYQKVYIS